MGRNKGAKLTALHRQHISEARLALKLKDNETFMTAIRASAAKHKGMKYKKRSKDE